MDQLDLPSENAALLVDLLDGKLRAMEFRHAHECKVAGNVFEQADLQRRFGRLGGTQCRRPEYGTKKRCSEQMSRFHLDVPLLKTAAVHALR